jgi:hypothetical protein
VSINIRGREWNDKYFVNIQAWKIEKTGSAKIETKPEPVQTNDSDDIPF